MLKRRIVQTLFFLLLAAMLLLMLEFRWCWYWLIVIVGVYAGVTFYGSSVIQANYFVNSLCRGCRDVKAIAITFDDGPLPAYTPGVLDILKRQKVPAAFFVIGKNVAGNEALLKRMDEEGHLVGNHSFEHNFWFSMKRPADMGEDMKKCALEILRATGKQPLLFRPPYGVTNPMVAKAINRTGYRSIGWSIRTFDTTAKNGEQLLHKSLKNLNNGDVLLFHDWGKYTIDILEDFIKQVRLMGFEIKRVDELLGVRAYA